MEKQFRESLMKVNKELKAEEAAESPVEKKQIKNKRDRMELDFVRQDIWHKESFLDVVAVQKKKIEIMAELHEKLKAVDVGESVKAFEGETEPRCVSWDEKKERAIITSEDGSVVEVTKGRLFTEPEWGVWFELDNSFPKEIRKKFLVEDSRRHILSLTDTQIAKTKMFDKPWKDTPENREKQSLMNETYGKVLEMREQNEMKPGIIAERIVKSHLKELAIDFNLPFEIIDSDVSQDIGGKADFYVHKLEHVTRVEVNEDEEAQDLAIQFTTDTSQETQTHKKEQIEEAKRANTRDMIQPNDLVLVTIPMIDSAYPYINWLTNGRKSGKTDLLKDKYKERIFRGVLQGVFSKKEIDDMWGTIHRQKPKEETPVPTKKPEDFVPARPLTRRQVELQERLRRQKEQQAKK